MEIKIKICEENATEINQIISEVEGRATARLCDFRDVEHLAGYIERHLERHHCPKKYRKGCKASYCEKIGVNAYKNKSYYAQSTRIYIYRGSSNWFFVGASRDTINPADKSSNYSFSPSVEAIDAILKNARDSIYSV